MPLVFINVIDPVGAGFIDSLSRPGGNVTGFVAYEYGIAAKWLELLKAIAPGVTRVAILRDAAISAGMGQFAAIQTAAPSFRVEVSPVNLRDAAEIERGVAAFACSPNGGMIVTGSALSARARSRRSCISTRRARSKAARQEGEKPQAGDCDRDVGIGPIESQKGS